MPHLPYLAGFRLINAVRLSNSLGKFLSVGSCRAHARALMMLLNSLVQCNLSLLDAVLYCKDVICVALLVEHG